MRFRTLTIEQRPSEVGSLLAAVKTKFDLFGQHMDKLKKQLDGAAQTIDQTGTRTRAKARKLREVERTPEEAASRLQEIEG